MSTVSPEMTNSRNEKEMRRCKFMDIEPTNALQSYYISYKLYCL